MPQLAINGKFEKIELYYLAMEKLGSNLKQLLRKNLKHKFSMKTTV